MRNFFSSDVDRMTRGHQRKAIEYSEKADNLYVATALSTYAIEKAADKGFLPTDYEIAVHNDNVNLAMVCTLALRPWFVKRSSVEAYVAGFEKFKLSHKDPRWA